MITRRFARWAAVILSAPCFLGISGEPAAGEPATDEVPRSGIFRLNPDQLEAARAARLGWAAEGSNADARSVWPVQWEFGPASREPQATWLAPPDTGRERKPSWRVVSAPFEARLVSEEDPASGHVELREAGRLVLQYNYRTVEPGEFIAQVAAGNRIYARARSDYIHPLCGPAGEVLTRDWSLDHPHHRGIYWAWPEVDFGSERGDLHALQRVFARPTGRIQLVGGPVFAQVTAENEWRWEERDPIVRERVRIRAYRRTARGRVVDLEFRFTALRDGVTVARRGTTAYGGLNLRLATPESQTIHLHTDDAGASPRRAWSDLSGIFAGTERAGLSVLQHRDNPEYPGDWVQYPELSWVQPTFPTAGTRYRLARDRPLVLRFRLWIHAGGTPEDARLGGLWDAWHGAPSVLTNGDE